MKIFLDTAEIEEIRTVARWGVLDGVTTNPTLYAKVGGSYDALLVEICKITSGPVSAEVIAEDIEGMLTEGRHFAKLAPNIVVKVLQQMVHHPLTDKWDRAVPQGLGRGPQGLRLQAGLIAPVAAAHAR